MKYVIISTYPEKGSKNVGDQLISTSTINAIKYCKGKHCQIKTIWRAEKWEEVKDEIQDADAVIFACLAIRKNMDVREYPYLQQLVDSKISFGIIAAGTSLPVSSDAENIFSGFSENVLKQLQELNARALFFTTRGYLTQSFCVHYDLNNAEFSGDISFFDERFSHRKFIQNFEIRKIAISDPHYGKYYLNSLDLLIHQLRYLFPLAELTILLHGINPVIEEYCQRNSVKYHKIYSNEGKGIDIYDSVHLHVGYRIHGHVAALNRRLPSYLLEQDGRGQDYGLTIGKKISVPSYIHKTSDNRTKSFIKKMLQKNVDSKFVSLNPVYAITAMINEDAKNGFEKFLGLEKQILNFNDLCLKAIKKLP